jgi:hypothetical protein
MRNSEQAAVPGGMARESQIWGVMRVVRVHPYGLFSAGIPGNFLWAPLEKIRNAACLTRRKNRAPGPCLKFLDNGLARTLEGSRDFSGRF